VILTLLFYQLKRTDRLYSQYVISSFINTAQRLLAVGITDFKMIDKFWLIAIQSKKGFLPFLLI